MIINDQLHTQAVMYTHTNTLTHSIEITQTQIFLFQTFSGKTRNSDFSLGTSITGQSQF